MTPSVSGGVTTDQPSSPPSDFACASLRWPSPPASAAASAAVASAGSSSQLGRVSIADHSQVTSGGGDDAEPDRCADEGEDRHALVGGGGVRVLDAVRAVGDHSGVVLRAAVMPSSSARIRYIPCDQSSGAGHRRPSARSTRRASRGAAGGAGPARADRRRRRPASAIHRRCRSAPSVSPASGEVPAEQRGQQDPLAAAVEHVGGEPMHPTVDVEVPRDGGQRRRRPGRRRWQPDPNGTTHAGNEPSTAGIPSHFDRCPFADALGERPARGCCSATLAASTRRADRAPAGCHGNQTAVDRAEGGDVPMLDVLLPPVVAGPVPEARAGSRRRRRCPRRHRSTLAPVPRSVGDDRPQPHAVAVGLEVPPRIRPVRARRR